MTKLNLDNFYPRGSWVVLEPDKDKTATLVLPNTAKKEVQYSPFATVYAAGPGRQLEHGAREELDLAPGDRVMVHTWQGIPLEIKGKEYICVQAGSIIGKISDHKVS